MIYFFLLDEGITNSVIREKFNIAIMILGFIFIAVAILLILYSLNIIGFGPISSTDQTDTKRSKRFAFLAGIIMFTLGFTGICIDLFKPSKANFNENVVDPNADPDRPPPTISCEMEISTPSPTDQELKEKYRLIAISCAFDSLLRIYSHFGIDESTLRKKGIDAEKLITPYSWQVKYSSTGSGYKLVWKLSYEEKPEQHLIEPARDPLPAAGETISVDQDRPGIHFGGLFTPARYGLDEKCLFNIGDLANRLIEIIERSKTITLTCEGFADPTPVGKINYTGRAYWSVNMESIFLGKETSYLKIPNVISGSFGNNQLSYARAHEGILCIKRALEIKDLHRDLVPKIKFRYRGNSIDSSPNSNEEKRRIIFHYQNN